MATSKKNVEVISYNSGFSKDTKGEHHSLEIIIPYCLNYATFYFNGAIEPLLGMLSVIPGVI